MPLNKEAVIRYNIIDDCLSGRTDRYPTMDDLIRACEDGLGKSFSVSTIQKDIKSMKEDELLGYLAPVRFSRAYNGYYYSDKNYTIKKVPLNDEEIDSLEFAAGMLERYKGLKVNDAFNVAVEKVFTSLRQKRMEDEKQMVIMPENTVYSKGYEHINSLIHCIREKIPVSFVHYSYHGQRYTSHVAHPYLLKEDKNRWYLIAWIEKYGEIRLFGLDRIDKIQQLDKSFHHATGFDPEAMFRHAIGVYLMDKKTLTTVTLKFAPVPGQYIIATPLHQSQKIIKQNKNGEVMVSIRVYPSRELMNLLFSYGREVTVISPEWLRKEMLREFRAAIGNYRKIRGK
jgi:predicted DNA-binding transcriptional regulator YafY